MLNSALSGRSLSESVYLGVPIGPLCGVRPGSLWLVVVYTVNIGPVANRRGTC